MAQYHAQPKDGTLDATAPPPRASLRLSAVKGKLSIELSRPMRVGPLTVSSLVSSLPGLRFPLDLSGGVARFRHRRGNLERLSVSATAADLQRYFEHPIRETLDAPQASVRVHLLEHGLRVGVEALTFSHAFSLLLLPNGATPQLLVTDAVSIGRREHPVGTALHLVRSLFGAHAVLRGSRLLLRDATASLVREVLLDAGARMPAIDHVRWGAWTISEGTVTLNALAEAAEAAACPEVIGVSETCSLCEAADNALAKAELDEAREMLLRAMESAPRHPELALRVATIDLLRDHPPEASLAMIVDALPAVDAGPVGTALLASLGDLGAARVATLRFAEKEPIAGVAARALHELAGQLTEPMDRIAMLDEALSRSPGFQQARWDRATAWLRLGHVQHASSDLGFLEAAAKGPRNRFDACMRAGELLLDNLQPQPAQKWFERALRYNPGSAYASSSLARAFLAVGQSDRGTALLARAVLLLEKTQKPSPQLLLDLAQALAEHAHDVPAAIARARAVPFGIPQTVPARALEGRWRAQLGDMQGASLAFAQARHGLDALGPKPIASLAHWFEEAATFEAEQRHDLNSALRHAEAFLRLRPRDPHALALFRDIAQRVAHASMPYQQASAPLQFHAPATSSAIPHQASDLPSSPLTGATGDARIADDQQPSERPPTTEPPSSVPQGEQDEQDASWLQQDGWMAEDEQPDTAEAEQRVEELTRIVQGQPDDQGAVLELSSLLDNLERHLELFALVSARLEETNDVHFGSQLASLRNRALRGLIDAARSAGDEQQALMYEEVLQTSTHED